MSFLSQPIQDVLIGPSRKIGPIAVAVVISESTQDTLTITKQPVQQGASVTDHSFKEPVVFSCTIQFASDLTTSLEDIYDELIELQESREPFDVVTPKRTYENMLFAALGQTTDKQTEKVLRVNATFQEAIIVKVSTTQVPRSQQKFPGATGKTENGGKKSALVSLKQGIGALIGK